MSRHSGIRNFKVLSERNKVAGLLPLRPVLTFFGCAKKVNKETHTASHSQKYFGSLANSLPCRQVKQARLKATKNTFALNRLGTGVTTQKSPPFTYNFQLTT